MAGGNKSSHPILDFHSRCNRILALMMVGENQPSASKVLAISEIKARLVTLSVSGREATVRRK